MKRSELKQAEEKKRVIPQSQTERRRKGNNKKQKRNDTKTKQTPKAKQAILIVRLRQESVLFAKRSYRMSKTINIRSFFKVATVKLLPERF